MAGAHGLVELGLGEVEGGFEHGLVIGGAGHERGRGRGKFAVEGHEPLARFVAGHAQQVGLGGVEVLRVARIGDPNRLACSQHTRQPVDLAQQVLQALGIVGLISFLVGLTLAFQSAYQLRQFGAQIYVADLVGIAMSQQMGALMVAIIMSGRSGAAFAAQIGTMQVSEEVDALQTMGLSPVEFLVLPRLLALMLMIPFLTVYADLLGILGGGFVGVTMLKLTATEYWIETKSALTLADFAKGLINGEVFGTLVALAGCLRGMQCGRSSAAVGLAVTSAVVTGIVWIVCSDAILTVIYNVLGF